MSRTVEEVLDEANANKLPTAAQVALLGRALRLNAAQFFAGAVAGNELELPETAKGAAVLSVWTQGGAGGYKAIDARETAAPAAGHCAITELGNIRFAAADAITDAEAVYAPIEGDMIEESIPVTAAGVGTLLQGRAAVLLLSAEITAGAAPGAVVVDPRATAVAAGHAAVAADGQIAFAAADIGAGGGTATVRYIARPSEGTGVNDSLLDRLASAVNT